MGSDLYLARIVGNARVTAPPGRLCSSYDSSWAPMLEECFGVGRAGDVRSFEAFAQRAVERLRSVSAGEAARIVARGTLCKYDEQVVERLRRDARSLGAAQSLAGAYWLGNGLLAAAHPGAFRPIAARHVTIHVVTIHPDAGLPEVGTNYLSAFAMRLLTEAAPGGWDKSPIYRHFPNDAWAAEDFGGRPDEPEGIVPFAAVAEYGEIEFTEAFRARYRDRWWLRSFLGWGIAAPSDNKPFAGASIELITFPAWAPKLVRGTYASRAYGYTV